MRARRADDGAWPLVQRALAEMGGFERQVHYDVPRAEAPRSLGHSRVFLQGSPSWRKFLAARAAVDDGRLTLLLSMRPLGDAERMLAADWGCRFANSFLLVEPADRRCDLSDPADPARVMLEATARRLRGELGADAPTGMPWTRETALGAAVRDLFGVWIAWPEPDVTASVERVSLQLRRSTDTLQSRLTEALADRYPQGRFDTALATLYERERELFGGPVARTRIPFMTRLGLPVLYDPRRVDRALRRLVNEGRAWVFEDGPDPAFYRGPQRPVPDRMTDAELERLVVR